MSLPDLPHAIDNLDWRSLDRWYLINQLFDTMVIFDRSLKLQSRVISRWQVLDDRRTIILWVKQHVRFSNGREIVASDIAYSLKRYLVLQPPDNPLKKAVVGASTLRDTAAKIDGVKILASNQLQIHLNRPFESIWSFLALPMGGGIVARESVDPATLKMRHSIASSGPYEIEKISEDHIRLKANRFYHELDAAAPQSIGFYRHRDSQQALQWFLEGKTNFFGILDPLQIANVDELLTNKRTIDFPLHRIGFIYLNPKHFHWRRLETRTAFSEIFDSERFLPEKNALMMWGNSFFPPGSPGFVYTRPSSQSLSDGALAGISTVSFLIEKGLFASNVESTIRSELQKHGIRASFEYLTKREMAGRFVAKEFDAALTSIGLPMADHEFGIYLYFVEKPQYLFDHEGRINMAYQAISGESDPAKRALLLRAISEEIRRAKYILPIYHSAVKYLMGDDVDADKPGSWGQDVLLSQLRVHRKR